MSVMSVVSRHRGWWKPLVFGRSHGPCNLGARGSKPRRSTGPISWSGGPRGSALAPAGATPLHLAEPSHAAFLAIFGAVDLARASHAWTRRARSLTRYQGRDRRSQLTAHRLSFTIANYPDGLLVAPRGLEPETARVSREAQRRGTEQRRVRLQSQTACCRRRRPA